MEASITAQKNGMITAVLDREAARVTVACVIFAARFHEQIVPLARLMEQQLPIEGTRSLRGEVSYAGDASRTR